MSFRTGSPPITESRPVVVWLVAVLALSYLAGLLNLHWESVSRWWLSAPPAGSFHFLAGLGAGIVLTSVALLVAVRLSPRGM